MNSRKLGQSGIDISTIGLGTNYVGGHNMYVNVDEAEGIRLVQRALDMGITHVDTADLYGSGRSEELIAKAIKGRRDEVVIATKGGMLFGEHGSGTNNDPAYLRAALERSLKRLDVDHVDLYYIHSYDGKTPVEEAFGALMDFKREGLIRAAGVSNFDLSTLQAAATVGPIDALQSCYNLLQREIEIDILPWCERNSVSFIPWGPLAYGMLGGRYTRDFTMDDDWRHDSGVFDKGLYERSMDVVDNLRAIADECSSTPGYLAIQWLLSRPAVGSVIAGAKRAEQVVNNAAADDVHLTEEQLTAIDSLTLELVSNRYVCNQMLSL